MNSFILSGHFTMAFPKTGMRGARDEGDAVDKLCDFLSGCLSEEQFNTAAEMIKAIQGDDVTGDQRMGADSRPLSYDGPYPIAGRNPTTGRNPIVEMRAIQAAEAAVRPFAGAMDTSNAVSAGAVYLQALRQLGHDTTGLPGSAAKAMFNAVKGQGVKLRAPTNTANDAAMRARFPGAYGLKRA